MSDWARRCGVWLWLGVVVGMGGSLEAQDLPRAQAYYGSGNYVELVALAEEVLEEESGRAEDWHRWRVEGLLRLGQYGAARAALTNALVREPRSVRLRWLGREVMRYVGEGEASAAGVKEILELVAARPWAYREAANLAIFGRAALEDGVDPKRVLERVYEVAKKSDPKEREVYLAAGELALAKHDFALAARWYQEGLKQLPADADLLVGLARAYAPSDPGQTGEALEAALKQNTNHVGGLLLLVDRRVDEEEYAAAAALLDRVMGVNPWEPEAWAYRAVLAHLQHQPEREQAAREMALRHWTNNPHVDHGIGRKLSQQYRFAEGAAYQRRALAMDSGFLPAKAQLAQDLLRLGEEAEGWRLAQEVQEKDGYDVAANNLMTLHDVLAQYATLTNAHFVVRMSASEAALYGERVLALLERARERLVTRYGLTLDRPVLVEIFAEAKDFAVRTFGMPEARGFLGVCFGPVVTANSPRARPATRFNWESMLWHEFCHVVTLQMTRNRMPRWLSEGISVYEERQADRAWGARMTPQYRARILEGELQAIGDMSAAFLAPPTSEHLQFAYYQSSLVVEYLVEKYGHERLAAVLRDLGAGLEVGAALERHAAPLATLEREFAAFARVQAEAMGSTLDWEKPPLEAQLPGVGEAAWTAWAATRPTNFWVLVRRAEALKEAEDWEALKQVAGQVLESYPEFTGAEGAYGWLAEAHRALGELELERGVLKRWVERDGEALGAMQRLLELGVEAKDWEGVLWAVERHLAVDPLVPTPYRHLAEAAEVLGDTAKAIGAYRACLRLDSPNPAEVHYKLARQLQRAGDPEARRQVLQALEEAPRYREALRLLLELQTKDSATKTAAEVKAEVGSGSAAVNRGEVVP